MKNVLEKQEIAKDDDDENTVQQVKELEDGMEMSWNPAAHKKIILGHLVFSSLFDSGNLAKVERNEHEDSYHIYTAAECCHTLNETEYTSWFHFSVSGSKCGETLQFSIMNMNKHLALYDHDYRPLFRSLPFSPKWNRLLTRPKYNWLLPEKKMQLTFQYTFTFSEETVYFAFCYPYSYHDCQKKLNKIENLYSLCHNPQKSNKQLNRGSTPTLFNTNNTSIMDSIYFHRELLTLSLQGRRIDLITISSTSNQLNQEEELIDGLLLDQDGVHNKKACQFQNKKVVFISSRVHPGETPSSFVFDGILDFLLKQDDPRAIALRNEFVFKLIPMLNPDGVFHGHFRSDTQGINLNRFYSTPSIKEHPSIYAAKAIVQHYHQQGNLVMYLDLHAHASKRGCFIYGNHLPSIQDQILTQLYAQLVEINSPYFEYGQCNFTQQNMTSKDKRDKGLSKDGSGRVALYKETQLVHFYTVECNYNMGSKVLSSLSTEEENQFQTSNPKYTPATWRNVGRALLVSILDLYQMNPMSRTHKSPHGGSLECMKQNIQTRIEWKRKT